MRFSAKILILTGISFLLFGSYLIFQRYNPTKLEFSDIPSHSYSTSSNFPKRLVINNFDIDLPIHPAQIKDNKWDATTQGVSYLTSSPIPGDTGNSIMYGHNWSNLLGSLPKIKPGDEIEIHYDDATSKKFIVSTTSEVEPTQLGILNNTTDTRLTLYTCSGFLDTKRFVAIALLQN